MVEAAEIALSRQLAVLVRYRFNDLNENSEEAADAVAETDHIVRDFTRAAALLSKLQGAYERDVSLVPADARDARRKECHDALFSNRRKLAELHRSFSGFLSRMGGTNASEPTRNPGLDGAQTGGASTGASPTAAQSRGSSDAAVWRPLPPVARDPFATSAASSATATAALRRTRAAMARELERLSAVGEAVENDSTAIEASRIKHLEYAGAVHDTYRSLWAQQREAWRSTWFIILAAGVLIAVVAYVVTSRILWLFGVAV